MLFNTQIFIFGDIYILITWTDSDFKKQMIVSSNIFDVQNYSIHTQIFMHE